jgi:hypothetical protein
VDVDAYFYVIAAVSFGLALTDGLVWLLRRPVRSDVDV